MLYRVIRANGEVAVSTITSFTTNFDDGKVNLTLFINKTERLEATAEDSSQYQVLTDNGVILWECPSLEYPVVAAPKPDEPPPKDVPFDRLEISVRAMNCLKNDHPRRPEPWMASELASMSQEQLLKMPNFGLRSVYELKMALEGLGFKPAWKFTPFQLGNLAKSYKAFRARDLYD